MARPAPIRVFRYSLSAARYAWIFTCTECGIGNSMPHWRIWTSWAAAYAAALQHCRRNTRTGERGQAA